MRIVGKIVVAVIMISLSWSAFGAEIKGWEPSKIERTEAKLVARDPQIEIRTMPGVIIVNVTHQTNIKIFTILGRLVSSETLPAGTLQFIVPAHGVYIVKAGDMTCKVAV